MNHISLDEMLSVYEKSRIWYGVPADMPESSVSVKNLEDVIENNDIELVLLDSYGVFCRGANDVIPEAKNAIQILEEKGIPYCVVSNDSLTTQETVEAKYAAMGFPFTAKNAVTSADVLESFLRKNDQGKFAATAFDKSPLKKHFSHIYSLNDFEGKLQELTEKMIFMVGKGWGDLQQENLVKSNFLALEEVVVANPDVGAPDDGSFLKTPGFWAYDFYEKTGFKKAPVLLGKPSPLIFEQALEKMGYKGEMSKVLMVGDSLHTDILGGQIMGFKTLLVRSGIFKNGGLEEAVKSTKIVPHFIANTI